MDKEKTVKQVPENLTPEDIKFLAILLPVCSYTVGGDDNSHIAATKKKIELQEKLKRMTNDRIPPAPV